MNSGKLMTLSPNTENLFNALWTNINYEPNLYQTNLSSPTEPFIKQQYDHETLQNKIKLITNNNQINYPSLKKISPKSVLRNSSTLPKLPINEHHQRRSFTLTSCKSIEYQTANKQQTEKFIPSSNWRGKWL
ncbi:unnamed protein product [Schistosoma mattheei]|uniref:Uncharacterized protein n=1 Tax=Schistosoma mattheei TaxID=31246 RepID=A0A183NZK6_9TREM|nr:unnamed protein product [Schistosoma mattheei]